MKPTTGGTLISGELAMNPIVWPVMFVWFGGVILIGGMMFVATLGSLLGGSSTLDEEGWGGILVFPVTLAFGFGFVRFGRYLARDEGPFLRDFLIKTLDAHPTDRAT
jgi:hypothetical protein